MCVLWFCKKKKRRKIRGWHRQWPVQELQRDMSVSSRLFEVCEHAGICSYRREKSALQSLREKGSREAWATMEGIVEKRPVKGLGLIKLNISRDALSVLHIGQLCKVSLDSFPVNN